MSNKSQELEVPFVICVLGIEPLRVSERRDTCQMLLTYTDIGVEENAYRTRQSVSCGVRRSRMREGLELRHRRVNVWKCRSRGRGTTRSGSEVNGFVRETLGAWNNGRR